MSAHAVRPRAAGAELDLLASGRDRSDINTAAMIRQLQAVMADDVGPFRTGPGSSARSPQSTR